MAIAEKATTLEQSVTMYSLSDNSIIYWINWAEKFIDCCERYLGWEVVQGPGTSLGAIVRGGSESGDGSYEYYQGQGSSAWDCDWTQPNGINSRFQGDSGFYNNHPLYTGWFHEIPEWPNNATDKGIDYNIGRFDFIVYTGKSKNTEEKIGFRMKYPICSIGYSYADHYGGIERTGNGIYGTPSVSLYSSVKGDIEIFAPDTTTVNYGPVSFTTMIYKGYLRFFGKRLPAAGYNSTNYDFWIKSDINDQLRPVYEENVQYTSMPWSLEIQSGLDEEWGSRLTYSDSFYDGHVIVPNRLFKNYWRQYNRFNYHVSKSGDTIYLYILNNLDHQVGFKLITTTLESGEKAIFLERQITTDNNVLFEVGAVTGTINNNPSQPPSNKLIRLPTRPYIKQSSNINRFSFSRMLIPTQTSLCTDLYYVVKRDIDDLIGDGQYVLVKDKNSDNHYFRVIPFGSQYNYEVSGDNTTYLAFPVSDPEVDDSGD